MALVSMQRTAKEVSEYSGNALGAENSKAPMYNYGTKLCLKDDDLMKLGIPMPVVGQKYSIAAVAECTSSRAEKMSDGVDVGADLQITDMEIIPDSSTKQDAATALWPDKK